MEIMRFHLSPSSVPDDIASEKSNYYSVSIQITVLEYLISLRHRKKSEFYTNYSNTDISQYYAIKF